MRRNKRIWIPPALIFCLATVHFSVQAELVHYTPQEVVAEFSQMNNGLGWHFTRTHPQPEPEVGNRRNLAISNDYDPLNQINVNAYPGDMGGISSSGRSYITTFYCREGQPEESVGYGYLPIVEGIVNGVSGVFPCFYVNSSVYIRPGIIDERQEIQYMRFALAFLYVQFLTGRIDNTRVEEFQFALTHLMSKEDTGVTSTDNYYIQFLLSIADTPYWDTPYNLLGSYIYTGNDVEYDGQIVLRNGEDMMGNYYVFVMSVFDADEKINGNKMLYAHLKSEEFPDPDSTPEPATLLLWTLGGLGLGGTSWLRHRNKKKPTLA